MRRIAIAFDSRRGRRRAARLRGGRADGIRARQRRRRQRSALTIQLFTNDANPKAGTCTLIEAIVTLNGTAVPDGTSVNFSTDFGTFAQNGLPLVSVVTTERRGGRRPSAAPARDRRRSRPRRPRRQDRLGEPRRSSSSPRRRTLPFVSSCSPSFGPKEGGTTLTLNGGRFFGTPVDDPGAVHRQRHRRKDGIVQSVSAKPDRGADAGLPGVLGSAAAGPDHGDARHQPAPTGRAVAADLLLVRRRRTSGTPTVIAVAAAFGRHERGQHARHDRRARASRPRAASRCSSERSRPRSSPCPSTRSSSLSPLQVGDADAGAASRCANIASGVVSNARHLHLHAEPMRITAVSTTTCSRSAGPSRP